MVIMGFKIISSHILWWFPHSLHLAVSFSSLSARFYHPVIDVPNWRPARLIGELRAEKGVRIQFGGAMGYPNVSRRARNLVMFGLVDRNSHFWLYHSTYFGVDVFFYLVIKHSKFWGVEHVRVWYDDVCRGRDASHFWWGNRIQLYSQWLVVNPPNKVGCRGNIWRATAWSHLFFASSDLCLVCFHTRRAKCFRWTCRINTWDSVCQVWAMVPSPNRSSCPWLENGCASWGVLVPDQKDSWSPSNWAFAKCLVVFFGIISIYTCHNPAISGMVIKCDQMWSLEIFGAWAAGKASKATTGSSWFVLSEGSIPWRFPRNCRCQVVPKCAKRLSPLQETGQGSAHGTQMAPRKLVNIKIAKIYGCSSP